MTTKVITLSLERYNELLRKEFVYELEREERVDQAETGKYVSEDDRRLYQLVPERLLMTEDDI